MRKIPTIFERNEAVKGHPVKDVVKPECAWVLVGEGVATLKWDGTNVKITDGTLYKRQKPKDVLPTNQGLRTSVSDRTFAGLRTWMTQHPEFEGIVFHHPDGRLAKIKQRDFGLPWPMSR